MWKHRQAPRWLLLFALLALPRSTTAGETTCWLAHENLAAIPDPRNGTPDPTRRGAFLQKFQYDIQENLQVKQTEFVLLRSGRGTPWGYCDKRFICHNVAVLPNPKVRIYRKVRLSNSQEFFKSRPEDDVVHKVPVYSSPGTAGKKVGDFDLASLFFVYGETNDSWLIGHTAEFPEAAKAEDPERIENVVRGWVPKDRCIEWNTRLSVEWNWKNRHSRKYPAVLFSEGTAGALDVTKSAHTIAAWLKQREEWAKRVAGGATAEQLRKELEKAGVYAYEPFEVSGGKLELIRMLPRSPRMPLLGEKQVEISEADPHLQKEAAWLVAGTAVTTPSKSEPEDKTRDKQKDKDKAEAAAETLKHLDVVLVIDATVSMREEIVASLMAVMELAEKLAEDDVEIKFGFVFFRDKEDYQPAKDWVEVLEFVNLPKKSVFAASKVKRAYEEVKFCFQGERAAADATVKASQRALAKLLEAAPEPFFETLKKAHAVEAVGGGQALESVFLGLEEALTNLDNAQARACKFAILIGDRGDNGKSGVTPDSLVEHLCARRQTPTSLAVLNVDGDEGKGLEECFATVVKELNRRVNDSAPPDRQMDMGLTIAISAGEQSKLTEAVQKQVGRYRNVLREERVKLIQAIETGDYSQLSGLGQKVLAADGLSIEQLQRTQGEIFRTALIPFPNERKTQDSLSPIRQNVLMTRTEVQDLILSLNGLVGKNVRAAKVKDGETLRGLLVSATQSLVGQNKDATGLSYSGALEQITGIPATSKLMTPGKLDELLKPENARELQLEFKRLTEVRQRLQDALVNKYSEFDWTSDMDEGGFEIHEMEIEEVFPFDRGKPSKQGGQPEARLQPKRAFQFGGVGDYYLWIDLDLEYP